MILFLSSSILTPALIFKFESEKGVLLVKYWVKPKFLHFRYFISSFYFYIDFSFTYLFSFIFLLYFCTFNFIISEDLLCQSQVSLRDYNFVVKCKTDNIVSSEWLPTMCLYTYPKNMWMLTYSGKKKGFYMGSLSDSVH